MKEISKLAVLVGGFVLAAGAPATRADVLLTGPDSNDGSYSTAALAGLATGTDTASSGGLTGISLWGLLGGADSTSATPAVYGDITTTTPTGDNSKNAILRYYLLGTSSSGAQSVFSLGELDPSFGGTAAVAPFVAYENTGGSLLAVPQLIMPGASGRDLTNLASLQILAVPALLIGPGGTSNAVTLSGNVTDPGTYTEASLESDFTPVTETVNGDNYTGVPLSTFIKPSESNVTSQIVVTAGTDGYEVVLSLAELDPSLGGNPSDLLPYADTGTDFPNAGVARTILPGDNKHGRWESNLDLVDVVTAVPEPGSLPIIATGLIALGLLSSRPRRRGKRS